jgi:two-component system cell cycle sensor histidine kinase/response regulator CckA
MRGFATVLRFLAPPVFAEDPDKTRRAGLLNSLLLSIIPVCLLLLLGYAIEQNTPPIVPLMSIGFMILSVFNLAGLRKGHVTLAASVFLGSAWILITLMSCAIGTIRAPSSAYYIVLVVVSSLVFKARGVIVTVVLSSLAIGGLIIAERMGFLPRPNYTVTLTQWISYTSAFAFAAYMMHYTLGAMQNAQASLQEATQRLHRALEFLPMPISIADHEGRIFYCNREFTARFGYTLDDLKDLETWFRSAYPDPAYREAALARWTEDIEIAFKKGTTTMPHRYEITCKDGAKKQVQITGRPTGDLLIGYFHDLTEMIQAQKEREHLEERLHQAEKLESLGVLAGGIAHDFNNLLGGVFGFIELARSADPGPRSANYLDRASGTIERARDLTRQLLTFSRGGAPARQTQSLAPVIREAAQFALSGSNVSLALDMPPDLWLCDFDKNQLSQVADNLVINACQAMPDGGTLVIKAANEVLSADNAAGLPAGRYVRVSFTDSGPGIPAEDLARVFDPFFSTKKRGHGLGLATAHSILRRHDGAITVESKEGQGSTFHVFLRESTGAQAPLRVNEPDVVHIGGRILVMDDEDFIREMASEMLTEIGYEASSARNGEEAIKMIEQASETGKPYSAVIMDLTIPGGMGGRDAVRALPSSQTDLVAIVSSGYSEDPVMAEPAKFGFSDKLEKPFRKAELARVLGRHLGRPRQSGV